MTPNEALKAAIEAAGGSALALARKISTEQKKVARQNVEHWLDAGRVPSDYCPTIERETGIRCELLRPDVPWGILREQAA